MGSHISQPSRSERGAWLLCATCLPLLPAFLRGPQTLGEPHPVSTAPCFSVVSAIFLLMPPCLPDAHSLRTGPLVGLFAAVPPAPKPAPLQELLGQHLDGRRSHLFTGKRTCGPGPTSGPTLVSVSWTLIQHSLFLQLSTQRPAITGPRADQQQIRCVAGLIVPAVGQGLGLASCPQWGL